MEIKYKFNKSSEARDCSVESVELLKYTSFKPATLQMFKDALISAKKSEEKFINNEILGLGICEQLESLYKTEIITSPQQLKDYINTIQESIEFIAESSIYDVLMKEWIGEWEREPIDEKLHPIFKKLQEEKPGLRRVIGSPKLNPNWTFKIQ